MASYNTILLADPNSSTITPYAGLTNSAGAYIINNTTVITYATVGSVTSTNIYVPTVKRLFDGGFQNS